MKEIGLLMIVAGVMMFAVSFVAFRPPRNLTRKSENEDDEDDGREELLKIMSVMKWGVRAVSGLAAVVGAGIYFLGGGSL